MDPDHFKEINDTMGHEVGDKALIDASNIIKQVFRDSDITARMGGDEFAVLIINSSSDTDKKIIARLEKAKADHNRNAGRPYQTSISYGVSHYNREQQATLDELIFQADKLMYQNKQTKKAHR